MIDSHCDKRAVRGAVVVALYFALAASAASEERLGQESHSESETAEMAATDSAEKLAAQYAALFKTANEQDIRRLRTSADRSIAVQSTFHFRGNVSAFPGRFLGFLEGALRVVPPARWQAHCFWQELVDELDLRDQILQSYKSEEGVVERQLGHYVPVSPNYQQTAFGFQVPKTTRIVADGRETVTFWVSNRSGRVNSREMCRLLDRRATAMRLVALIESESIYVAQFGNRGSQFVLSRFDADSGALEWRSEVWAIRAKKFLLKLGSSSHDVELVLSGDPKTRILYVFGYSSTDCYIEGFRASSGDAIFRFSSNYWSSEAAPTARGSQ